LNYKPFTGYWFYGGASGAQRASFYASWGLLAIAPAFVPSVGIPTSLLSLLL